jgi:hypothetical protein
MDVEKLLAEIVAQLQETNRLLAIMAKTSVKPS